MRSRYSKDMTENQLTILNSISISHVNPEHHGIQKPRRPLPSRVQILSRVRNQSHRLIRRRRPHQIGRKNLREDLQELSNQKLYLKNQSHQGHPLLRVRKLNPPNGTQGILTQSSCRKRISRVNQGQRAELQFTKKLT